MSKASSTLIQHIRLIAGTYRDDNRSDSELLTQYAAVHDETAFATLMARHGALVWRMCRNVLGNVQDVEDAFQATFLMLSRKASQIHVKKTLAGWLHQVGQRTALNLRRAGASRQKLEARQRMTTSLKESMACTIDERYEILHEELAKLPEKQRVALVLHYLEGKTQGETAEILGVTPSSVQDRLTRGKTTLEKRLARRGLSLGAALVATLLEAISTQAGMPPCLIGKTVKAAAAFNAGELTGGLARLAQEVLKNSPAALPWWKTGWLIAFLCLSCLGLGAGSVAWKSGFFGTKAEGLLLAKYHETSVGTEKKDPKSPRFDLYGDPLPPGALARLGTVRLRCSSFGHPRPDAVDTVDAMFFTPDAKGLVTAGKDIPACLWDLTTGKSLREFGKASDIEIHAATLSANGRLLAGRQGKTGRGCGDLCLWEISTGKFLRRFPGNPNDLPLQCALAPNGETVTAILANRLGAWDVATGRELWSIEAPPSKAPKWLQGPRPKAFALSPDGKTVVSCLPDSGRLVFQDVLTGKKVRELPQHQPLVQTVQYSPDGAALLVTDENGDLSMCDVKSGKHRWKISSGDSIVKRGLKGVPKVFSPDGSMIAAHIGTQFVQLWDAATGKKLRRFRQWGGLSHALAFSPCGTMIASASDSVIVFWDPNTGKPVSPCQFQAHSAGVTGVAVLPDQDTLASGAKDGTLRLWDLRTGRQRQVILNNASRPSSMQRTGLLPKLRPTISPNERILAMNFAAEKMSDDEDAMFMMDWLDKQQAITQCWDVTTGRRIRSFQTEGAPAKAAFSQADNRLFQCTTIAGWCPIPHMVIWDSAGKKKTDWTCKEFGHDFAPVMDGNQPLFSPKGDLAITFQNTAGKREAKIHFWDVTARVSVHHIAVPMAVTYFTLSQDQRIMAVGDGMGIRLLSLRWESGPGYVHVEYSRDIDCSQPACGDVCEFSPDGAMLASAGANGAVRLFESASGKERACFVGHERPVTALCFAADGQRVISGSEDATLLVWDVTGRLQKSDPSRAARLSRADAERLWQDLASEDPKVSTRALWELAAGGAYALSYLQRQLAAAEIGCTVAPSVVNQLIKDLDAPAFKDRKQAKIALSRLQEQCELALRQVLQGKPSLEKRRTLVELLSALEMRRASPPVEILQKLRAVEVLEHIGTTEAEQTLKKLSNEACHVGLREAAMSALRCLQDRQNRRKAPRAVAAEFDP